MAAPHTTHRKARTTMNTKFRERGIAASSECRTCHEAGSAVQRGRDTTPALDDASMAHMDGGDTKGPSDWGLSMPHLEPVGTDGWQGVTLSSGAPSDPILLSRLEATDMTSKTADTGQLLHEEICVRDVDERAGPPIPDAPLRFGTLDFDEVIGTTNLQARWLDAFLSHLRDLQGYVQIQRPECVICRKTYTWNHLQLTSWHPRSSAAPLCWPKLLISHQPRRICCHVQLHRPFH